MNGCHRCEHQAAVKRGVYAGVRWEDTPCSRCEEPSYDLTMPVDDEALAAVAEPDPDVDQTRLPISCLADLAKLLLSLRAVTREAVCLRYLGVSYYDIGRRLRITEKGARMRVARAVERFPVLMTIVGRKKQGEKTRVSGGK